MNPRDLEQTDHAEVIEGVTTTDLQPTVIGAVSRPVKNPESELEVLTGNVIGSYTDNMGGTGQRLPPP